MGRKRTAVASGKGRVSARRGKARGERRAETMDVKAIQILHSRHRRRPPLTRVGTSWVFASRDCIHKTSEFLATDDGQELFNLLCLPSISPTQTVSILSYVISWTVRNLTWRWSGACRCRGIAGFKASHAWTNGRVADPWHASTPHQRLPGKFKNKICSTA
jgi:hypothetical protein